ncbi:hypothetical protein FSST1_002653 [Fusarium sambucinum]
MASLLGISWSAFRRFGTTTKFTCSNLKLSSVTLTILTTTPAVHRKMIACTLCHNRKVSAVSPEFGPDDHHLLGPIEPSLDGNVRSQADFPQVRCEADAESNGCVTCKAAGVECIPRSRKRRRAGIAPITRQNNDDASPNYENDNRQTISQASGVGIEIPVEQPVYQTPSTSHDTTYIGRGHYVADDDEIDETSARAFEPAKIKEKSSMLLAQSLWLAGSRVTNAPSVVAFASSDDFYHRAKAVFWSGVEADGLSAIKASLMLQWYNPQAPEHILFDNSGFWLKIGVGIAHQIGLHRESPSGPSRAIRRRLWWSLVVRDSLISVAHDRPRIINLDDSDVQAPIASDFPDSLFAFQLFSSWELWVAPSNQPPHSYFANSHNLPARQLYLPYFTSLIVLSRMQHSAGSLSVVATLAASFVARIFEDFLARDEIKVLAPISTRYCLISSMALVSVMPDKRLWDAVQPDLEVLQLALTELSKRWRSAIGSSRALQNAIKKRQERTSSSTATLRLDNQNSLEYFKMIDLGYCRIWSTLSQQLSSSPLDIQQPMPQPIQPLGDTLETNYEQFMDPGEAFDMGTIQFEHVENWILNDGFLFDS